MAQLLNSIYTIAKYLNIKFSTIKISKLFIFLKFKSSKYKYLFKTIFVILKLKKLGQLYNKNAPHLKISKLSVITIFY